MSVTIQHLWINDRREHAIYLGNGTSLVQSGEDSDTFYVTSYKSCDCKSYQYRGTCRHLDVAHEAEAGAKVEAALHDLPLSEVEWP